MIAELVKLASNAPSQEEVDNLFDQLQEDGDCILAIAPSGHCAFMYYASVIHWCFDLLSEVGEPYQPTFKDLLAENKLELTTVEERDKNGRLSAYYNAVSVA